MLSGVFFFGVLLGVVSTVSWQQLMSRPPRPPQAS